MSIFSILIDIRKEKKISIIDMSGYLGIDRRSVYNYEKGIRKVPLSVVEGYAERFGYELRLMIK